MNREAGRRLARMGCVELPRRHGGSPRKWHHPTTDQATVIPDWGSRDLKLGTLRAAVSQLDLDWKSFEVA